MENCKIGTWVVMGWVVREEGARKMTPVLPSFALSDEGDDHSGQGMN